MDNRIIAYKQWNHLESKFLIAVIHENKIRAPSGLLKLTLSQHFCYCYILYFCSESEILHLSQLTMIKFPGAFAIIEEILIPLFVKSLFGAS